jgi:CO/xanthine dehydrogenase Mo-binding subunit
MTGFLHERELSRKTFLKGGGAMVVGFSLAGAGLGASAANAQYEPDKSQADSWLTINPDNTASLKTSHIELGNGLTTGLLMVMAEELDMSMDQVRHSPWDSDILVDSGLNGGSTAIQSAAGPPLRAAAASAKQTLLGLASKQLGVPVSSLSVDKGVVSGGGKSVTYGQLVGGKLLNAKLSAPTLNPGQGIAKPVAQYRLVGTRVPRVDIPAKITGQYTYVHNVRLPGMVHGRVVRPRGQGTYGTGAKIVSVDESSIKHIPGAGVVRDGDFIGVVAAKEYDAIQAAAQLKVKWDLPASLPGSGNLWKQMRTQDSTGKAAARLMIDQGDVDSALKSAAKTVSASYKYHYNGRMPIGPCCALADVTPSRVTIYSNSQAVEVVVPTIAAELGVDPAKVRSLFYEGASSFGATQSLDVARAAAVMSRAVGKPVRVQLMRWDEHGWDNYGQAHLIDMRGGIDAGGKIVAYDHMAIGQPGSSQFNGLGTAPDLTTELRHAPYKYPTPGTFNANTPNTGPMYDVANRRVGSKTLPLMEGYLRVGALRDPQGPQTSFASEQLIDELAYAAGMDPIEFRRKNISDDRWLTALNAAASAAKWEPRVANSVKQSGDVVRGRGFGFGRHGTAAYAAAVVDVEVNKKTGKITAKQMYLGMDAGLSVNPALVENQMSGAAIQGLSRALWEEVGFTKTNVTALDWVSYPILRFKDHPAVTLALVQRTDQLPLGTGEPMTTPIAPAIANAFFDATGVRIREAPMTPARVRAVLKAAGVS